MKFCECGSIKIDGACSNKRCPRKNARLSKWIIGGREFEFIKLLTKDEAEQAVINNPSLILKRKKQNTSDAKPFEGGY